jgi:tetratricopeptide (TPR) repeat protein
MLSHFWCDAGDVGRLECVKLWKVAEDLQGDTSKLHVQNDEGDASAASSCRIEPAAPDDESVVPKAHTSLAAKHLCSLGAQLSDALLVEKLSACDSNYQQLNLESFRVLRALFHLMKDLRLEAAAHDFLVRIKSNLESALSAHSGDETNPVVGCIRVAFAWVHACIGDSLKDLGEYSNAIEMWQRSIREFAANGVDPSFVTCDLHRCVGVVHDLEARYEEALAEFELARAGIHEIAQQQCTKTIPSKQTDGAADVGALQSLIADVNDSHSFSSNSSRLQIFTADLDKEVANVLFSLERFEEALDRYRSVYTTLKRVLGETHPTTARAIWGIGAPHH